MKINENYLETISEPTSLEPSLKRFVICIMCSARFFLSDFIQACPRNSLKLFREMENFVKFS